MVKPILKGMLAGLGSGILLAIIMKYVELYTEKKIYSLLLNIDFIPLTERIQGNEPIELVLHLLVSSGFGVFFVLLKPKFANKRVLTFLLILPAILLYFPLSYISRSEITSAADLFSFLLWSAAHVVYALILPL
ncbi:hypothetical protein [Bacillus sp. CECT 9360]|uniref:hypothetical protein n=1 Tax=Bacillus sp. CECT 9360 TaxID=2845821 RepID=UPI001E471C6C|nr:hypothetical protein [Bacillus sp. CECT 9360]CAH0345948.1 hypothetical protein BCI9360_02255 [Bacillus sp. CECT 9360]